MNHARISARVEKGSEGLPVGIHVASRWWREDLTLVVMKRLEDHFRATADFPDTPVGPAGGVRQPQSLRGPPTRESKALELPIRRRYDPVEIER